MRYDLLWDSTNARGSSTLYHPGQDPRTNLVHAGGAPTEPSSSLVQLSVEIRRPRPRAMKRPSVGDMVVYARSNGEGLLWYACDN